MSIKWQRNYVLNVQDIALNTITIQYPLTLEFYIKQTGWQGISNCLFRIYNLQDSTRQGIRKDWADVDYFRTITLNAGYGQAPYPLIFTGNVQSASSWRDSGSVNYITEINGLGFQFNTTTSFINTKIAPSSSMGVSKQLVIKTLVDNLMGTSSVLGGGGNPTGLGYGYITQAFTNQYYPRGRVLFGNTWNILQQETNNTAFITNGTINIMQNNDYFIGGITLLNADTGLLSTPKKYETQLEVEILFEPNIQPGQFIQLQSVSSPEWNGNYKVYSMEHRGIISGAVNGKCTTKLILYNLAQANLISNQGFSNVSNS